MGCHALGHKLHIGWLEQNKSWCWDSLPWKLACSPPVLTLPCQWHLSQQPISFILDQSVIKHPCRWLYSPSKTCALESFVSQKPDKFCFHSSLGAQCQQAKQEQWKADSPQALPRFYLHTDHLKESEPENTNNLFPRLPASAVVYSSKWREI